MSGIRHPAEKKTVQIGIPSASRRVPFTKSDSVIRSRRLEFDEKTASKILKKRDAAHISFVLRKHYDRATREGVHFCFKTRSQNAASNVETISIVAASDTTPLQASLLTRVAIPTYFTRKQYVLNQRTHHRTKCLPKLCQQKHARVNHNITERN